MGYAKFAKIFLYKALQILLQEKQKSLHAIMFAIKNFHADLADSFYRNNKTKISA